MAGKTTAERIVRRDRAVTIAGMLVLAVLAWSFLLTGAGMGDMAGSLAEMAPPGFLLIATMWWVMMIAMMVPSASPAILLYAQVHRARVEAINAPPTAAFLFGYLACWLAFSLVAAAAQLWLQAVALASPMAMALHSHSVAGLLLIAAGAYQLSPLKNACLAQCRSPAVFLSRHYRPGTAGAFRIGVLHGAFCVGCCWLLMLLLFVGGVMNLAWIAGLALLVAAEKLLPYGEWLARLAGLVLIGWGLALFVL